MSAPLPVFTRPPSAERDATIMRPSALDSSTLLRVHRPENPPHPPPATSEDDLLPPPPTPPPPLNDDYLIPSPRPTTPSSWGETSFVDPALVPPPPEPAAPSSNRHHNHQDHNQHHHQQHKHHQHHNHHRQHDATSSPGLPESRSTQPLLDDNSPGESPRRLQRELTNSVNSVTLKCGVAPSPASDTPTRTSDISCSGGEGGADSRSSSQCDRRQAVGSLISLEGGEEAVVPPPPLKVSPALRKKNALRATLSLDPSALDRHGTIMDNVDVIKPPAQYANVTPTRTPTSKREKIMGGAAEMNQSPQNGSPSRASPAFTVQTTASTRHLLSDTEISC